MNRKEYIITGIKVSEQMEKANTILNNIVIPREKEFQKRKKNNSLSKTLLNAIKVNA
jgi:hypothetical protein